MSQKSQSKESTAERLLSIAKANDYGAESGHVTNSELVGWANGSRICPKWAYIAAMHLALIDGWRPATEDEFTALQKTAKGASLPDDVQTIIDDLKSGHGH